MFGISVWDEEQQNKAKNVGPIEVEETGDIFWNANDWPCYIKCSFAVEYPKLAILMQKGWNISRPQIMITVISQFDSLTWNDMQLISKFKKGIIRAASAAHMWLITNGVDVGISKILAEAIANEKLWQKSKRQTSPILDALCIGVVRDDRIQRDPLILRNLKDDETNPLHVGQQSKEKNCYIDRNHSHFIFVKNEDDADLEQLLALDLMFELSHKASWVHQPEVRRLAMDRRPLIAILVEGDSDSATVVLQYLSKQLPVVVLMGSGGFADLLSYACIEIEDKVKQEGVWDQEFIDDILKPNLSGKIVLEFPTFRDKPSEKRVFINKIVDCVRYGTQENIEFLTIINAYSTKVDLEMMDHYLLEAYFKSRDLTEQIRSQSKVELLKEDLKLTVAWNNAVIAKKILTKTYPHQNVTKELFIQVLCQPEREEFLNLFLENGFPTRSLYNTLYLSTLMRKACETEFFLVVCCESILGISATEGFPLDNLIVTLNRLISITCGLTGYIRPDDVYNRYQNKPSCIEQKSLTFITMWAVFTNKMILVNQIWPYHSEPISLILMVTTMLIRMKNFVNDLTLKQQMIDDIVVYKSLATKLLDECYQSSPARTTQFLSQQSEHWNYQSASDVAAAAQIHDFIAHPSCQRWLTRKFMNDIHIKQSPVADIVIPQGVKIILCAFFVFPIYLWLDFPQHVSEVRRAQEHQERLENKRNQSPKKLHHSSLLDGNHMSGTLKPSTTIKVNIPTTADIPLSQKWSILWTSAVTKYWVHQLFFILFLIVFSYNVVAFPCGNMTWDTILFVWLSLMIVDDIRKTYIILRKYVSVDVTLKYFEIPMLIGFTTIFYIGRMTNFVPINQHQYGIRMLMCGVLYHYYFRYLALFIPISSTFGPLFYSLKLMTFNDFFQFVIVCLPVIIVSALVVKVSNFPDLEFSWLRLVDAFHFAFFAMFITIDGDLFMNETCRALVREKQSHPCFSGSYSSPYCAEYGAWPYIFTTTYFINIKLILLTLLYALFNNSLATLDGLTIWRYQRFQLTSVFYLCLPLPPPLNIFCYLYSILRFLFEQCCLFCCKKDKKTKRGQRFVCHGCPDETTAYFSKYLCRRLIKKIAREKAETSLKKLREHLQVTSDHIDYTRAHVKQLRRTVTVLQASIFQLQVNVEETTRGSNANATSDTSSQILSRQSPYPGTLVERCPISQKYIPWEISWLDYDPPSFSAPTSSFPPTEYPDEENPLQTKDPLGPPKLKPKYLYNFVTKVDKVIYDRRSWITDKDNRPIAYKLDGIFPLNPIGRTGLAGRGSLPRWGPNHFTLVLVTRFSSINVGKMEIFLKKMPTTALVGGFVATDDTYDVVKKQVDIKTKNLFWNTASDMIKFFASKVALRLGTTERIIREEGIGRDIPPIIHFKTNEPVINFDAERDDISQEPEAQPETMQHKNGLQYRRVRRGYMDDPLNTDNVWKEVEFWHFHYTYSEDLRSTKDPNVQWTPFDRKTFQNLNPGEAQLLQNYTKTWVLRLF